MEEKGKSKNSVQYYKHGPISWLVNNSACSVHVTSNMSKDSVRGTLGLLIDLNEACTWSYLQTHHLTTTKKESACFLTAT